MKYITITSKHHDGFAMWNSQVSDYNIVKRTPYGKDVLKMLADECRLLLLQELDCRQDLAPRMRS